MHRLVLGYVLLTIYGRKHVRDLWESKRAVLSHLGTHTGGRAKTTSLTETLLVYGFVVGS